MLEHHPHSSLTDLLRRLGRSGHGSILSRAGASKIPGAVQTYELLGDAFVCRPRGTIPVKGMGEMETWYLVDTR